MQCGMWDRIRNTGLALTGTVILGSGTVSPAGAQDAHYWTNQYGTRSILLGGAVVGSVDDLSSVFYNPGALGLLEDPELVLAAKVFQYSNVIVDDAAGTNDDLGSPRLEEAPGFFAGLIDLDFLGRNRFGYSLFTKRRMNIQIEARKTITGDLIPSDPGMETLFGQIGFWDDLSEEWFGLTWSPKRDSKLGLGISNFFALRSQRLRSQAILEAFAQTGDAAATIRESDLEFNTLRLLWKIGIQYKVPNLEIGLAVTTPSVYLGGKGTAAQNLSFLGQDLDDNGSVDNFVASTLQEDVSVTYKSPLSVASGLGYDFGSTTINFSAEWFNKMDQYDVMDVSDYIALTTGDTVEFSVQHQLDAVINFGAGVQQMFSKNVKGFVSFNTDQSAIPGNTLSDIALANWDILHLFTGAEFTVGSASFTLGLGYSFGDETSIRKINLKDADEDNNFEGTPSDSAIQYRASRFLIGVTLGL